MALYLVAPGQRTKRVKGKPYPNRYYLVRGTVRGERVEVSAETADKKAAEAFKIKLELALIESGVPGLGEEVTFARAAALYSAFKDPSKADTKRIDKLNLVLGDKPVGGLRHADLVDAANALYPRCAAATKNREAMRPAAAILHYAASNAMCAWLRVPLFKEERPKTRAVTQDVARAIIASLPEEPAYRMPRSERWLARARERQRKKILLLLWLFRQGTRISDALKIADDQIDLRRRVVTLTIGKAGDEQVEEPLHDEVWEMLASDPPGPGRLFPWRTKSGVYAWLRPYVRSLGINFTPHMARHSLGKWLNEDGASLRTIMDTLHHRDVKSSARYQSTDIEVIRQIGRRLGRLRGKSGTNGL